MSEVQIIDGPNTVTPEWADVVEKRNAVAQVTAVKYGVTKDYAIALFNVLPAEWYLVEHNSLQEADKPVLAEGKAFREALKAAGHKNPSVEWTRVRKEGRLYAEGEAESNGASAKRSLTLRLIEELTKLHKAGKAAESLSTKEQDALTYVNNALLALGIDTNMITTK